MRSRFLLSFLGFVLLCNCSREEGVGDCPEPGPKAFDVVSGPFLLSGVFGGQSWAFISDRLGASADARVVAAYPFFLDYEGECQEEYTLNVIERVVNLTPSTIDDEGIRLTSYLNVKAKQAIDLLPEVTAPRFPYFAWPQRTISINNIPAGYTWTIIPEPSYIPMEVDQANAEIRLDIVQNNSTFQYHYLTGTPAVGEGPTKALLIDLVGGPVSYDFATEAQSMHYESVVVEGEAESAWIGEVIDQELGNIAILGWDTIVDGKALLPVVNRDAPHLLTLSTRNDSIVNNYQRKIYDQFPLNVVAPVEPIQDLVWTESDLWLRLNRSGHLMVRAGPKSIFEPSNYRRIIGVLPAGQHRIPLTHTPANYRAENPNVHFPTDIYKEGFEITFWSFPELSETSDYWQ